MNATIEHDAPALRLVANAHPRRKDSNVLNFGAADQPVEDDVPFHYPGPPLLVSFVYVRPFLSARAKYRYNDWVMDSGAFSAHMSGADISLQQYIDCCHHLLATDPKLTEVFALDVIGDPEASMRNTEEMWRQGVPAVPCYHFGEPEELLLEIGRKYPKIALGGTMKVNGRMSTVEKVGWQEQCFARVWPKKIHGFGVFSEEAMNALPFHSVDATNWEIGPCAFGNWIKFGTMSVRGDGQDLRSQVHHFAVLQEKMRVRWAKEMALLESLDVSKLAKPGPRPDWVGKEVPASVEAALGAKKPKKAKQKKAAPPAKPAPAKEEPKKEPAAPEPAAPAKAEKKKPEPGAPMEQKWVNYWKNRKF